MTILAELRAEVQTAWQRSPTQTVLWLDPQREWERLLDQLAAELELVKYAGSQLELLVKIELEPAQQPRIVYVPLPRQALSVLKEYEFTLPVWDDALLHALRRWGVGIERDEEKSLLPLVRERCLHFLLRWLEARTQAQTAAQLLRAAEQDMPLGPWAAALESIPDIQSSLQVERTLVQRVLTDLHTRSALDERTALLHNLLPVFRRHAAHFWAIEGEALEWEALSLAGSVVASAWAALAELHNLRTAAEIVQAYVDRWWQVDRAYQRYRAGFEEHGGLDDVADTVRKLHRRYLEETNKRFAAALAAEGLEATGLPPQRSFWPASAGGSRAVLVLDAFRFDLARELEETLRGAGGQVTAELHALRAPLPSITPLGMASLLPLETIQADVSDGTWAIRPGGADAPDLATKAGREQWLASFLDGYKSIELGKLLDLPVRQVPRAPWLFVYSTTLDEAGHGGVISLTPRAAEEYVAQCARAIRKLASAGVEHIHVVTDHGFFLLDEVADHDLIPVAAQDVHYKSHRAVVGRDIASLPGWELPKMQPEYFTNHLGFIVDYMAEIFRELRKRNHTDAYEHHFRLGNHVEERDRKAIVKTVSGLLKLLHPGGQCTKAELEQYLSFAIEMRRRVKEQLKRMGGIEYAKVNLSYIDLESGQETFLPCPELGVIQLIPEGQNEPGDVFTVGLDKDEGRFGLFRIQVQATKGNGHLRVTGSTSKPMRDALQTAYDYLRANLRRLGSDRDLKDFDLHVQIHSLMQAKEGAGIGVAFFIALLSAVLARPLVPQLVILGDLTIHGVLMRVDSLADKLKTAMDAGAKKVMIPTENKRDFADLPADIIDKLQIVFYSDPTNAAFRAMGLE